MFNVLLFLVICFLLFKIKGLSKRIADCEKKLGLSQDLPVKQEKVSPVIEEVPLPQPVAPVPIPKIETAEPKKEPRQNFKIPSVIKDNWIAFAGSLACIVGVIFFGITSSFFAKRMVRVGLMLLFSIALWISTGKLKQNKDLVSLSKIFTSVSGVITLFATFGAGEISGLRCIDSPVLSLAVLSMGIGFNLYLAIRTSSQIIASIHVLFSLVALCIPAPTALFLPLGTIIALIGLCNAYKSKWDLHLILITAAFTLQNILWTYRMEMSTNLHYLAILCSTFVALGAAAIHYSKNYQAKEFKALPVFAHLINWGLFALNIGLHAPSTRWASIFLFAAAICGFILARVAKKREISWLYILDTLLSQIALLIAIAFFSSFSIKPIDLSMAAVVEMLLFIQLANAQKEKVLVQAGYMMQLFVYGASLVFCMFELSLPKDSSPIYLRMGVITALYWGSYIYFRAKEYICDTFSCIWFYENQNEKKYSLMALFGTCNFIIISLVGAKSLPIQCIALIGVAAIAVWRHKREDLTWDLSFLGMFICLHLQNFIHLFAENDWMTGSQSIALLALDSLLIFKNMLEFKVWRRDFYQLCIYALAILLGLFTYYCSKTISIYIPTFTALAYSLLALELTRFKRFEESKQIQLGFLVSGFGYILYYLISFVTVSLQFETYWHHIPLRIVTEILGILTLSYWIYFKPKFHTKALEKIGSALPDILLGFITLCVFLESPDLQRPLCWTVMALGLLIATRRFNWPARLYTYSWIYLLGSIIHIAFITYWVTFPKTTFIDRLHLHASIPIILQLIYAYLVHKKQHANSLLAKQPTTAVLLPIFLGIGLLFAYNFEKTLLTLLWVGLTSVYITLGLLVKNQLTIRIGMAALILCSARLVIFDLMQSNILVRALVFFGVGILMMIVGVIYKKYKHRITT